SARPRSPGPRGSGPRSLGATRRPPRRGPSGVAPPASAGCGRVLRLGRVLRRGVGAPRQTRAIRIDEPRGDRRVEGRELVEGGKPEPLEEVEAGAVEVRTTGGLGPSELDDEPAVEQRPERVVRVDAPDAFDQRTGDRLAVGDSRKGLTGSVRQ